MTAIADVPNGTNAATSSPTAPSTAAVFDSSHQLASKTTRFSGGLLRLSDKGVAVRLDGERPSKIEAFCASLMKGLTQRHPCIGARSVSKNGNLFLAVYEKMSGVESAWLALRDLEAYYKVSDTIDDVVKTLAMVFVGPPISDAADFARKYWSFVQDMHDIDVLSNEYDATVSDDVASKSFELSLGGRAIFTTTLNPAHPRPARRASFPVWVCNQTRQFDHLRKIGVFEKWHQSITEQDTQLDPTGLPNPLLANHGYASAVDQLPGWSIRPCPFTARRSLGEKNLAFRELYRRAEAEGVADPIKNNLAGLAKEKFGGNNSVGGQLL